MFRGPEWRKQCSRLKNNYWTVRCRNNHNRIENIDKNDFKNVTEWDLRKINRVLIKKIRFTNEKLIEGLDLLSVAYVWYKAKNMEHPVRIENITQL